MSDGLKERDLEILAAIEDTYKNTGFVPSYSDIAEQLNMSKGSVLVSAFGRLEAARKIIYNDSHKQYLPARWRELAAFEVIERQREMTRDRVQRFREKKRNSNVTNSKTKK